MRPQFETVLARREEVLRDLFALLRYPSISATPAHTPDVAACAVHLAEYCRRLGLEAEAAPTRGHPAVIARTPPRAGRPTLLVYGHYDVQPVEPLDQWERPPFEPAIVDGKIRARGASDDKGQLFTHLAAVGACLRDGGCPVNVVFLIEGEEEIGSLNLAPLVDERRAELACDAIVISDTAQFGPGVPAICYGLRGMVYLEVELAGPAHDLHSGSFGGAVDNPANVLARMLATLQDADRRVTIPGFYDAVRPLSEAEREEGRRLGHDEAALRESTGAPQLAGEPGYSALERVGARPSLDINGLLAGHIGEGAKTVLPARALAKVSMRLVPDQEPEDIVAKTVAHLERVCPPTVRMTVRRLSEGRPLLVALDTPELALARRALKEGFGRPPVMVREGGSIPVVGELVDRLAAPCLLIGFGLQDDNAHAPNEKLSVDDFFRGIHTSIALMELFGEEER